MEISTPIKKIVTHVNCMDGLASALLLQVAYPDAAIQFVQYNTQPWRELDVVPGMLFCDMSPPRERVHEFVEAGAYCLDHHKYAKDVVEAFGARGVFADEVLEPGVSGAMLAMREVLGQGYAPRGLVRDVYESFALLVGVRDTWQKSSPNWDAAQELHQILEHLPREYWLGVRGSGEGGGGRFDPMGVDHALELLKHGLGAHLLLVHDQVVAAVFERKQFHKVDDWGLVSLPVKYTSDVAERGRQLGIRNLMNAWLTVEDGIHKTVFSLRSDGSVDVGLLAREWGGGGHSRAAGFSLEGWGNPVDILYATVRGATVPVPEPTG